MNAVFLKILNMSIAAGWLIAVVVLLRFLLKKAPKWISCVLWALVALKLLIPFSFESSLSLLPSGETITYKDVTAEEIPVINTGIPVIDDNLNPAIEKHYRDRQAAFAENPANANETAASSTGTISAETWTLIGAVVWITGMIGLLLYALITYLKLRRKVSASNPVRDRIRVSDEFKTPFILGIVKPVICMPSSLGKDELEYVLAHEEAHLKRHDHWWKPLGYLLLAVYWFNPLCWLAYILLCRDIEAACDEKAIREMDRDEVASYSQTLLNLSIPRRQITACPLAFGEVGVKQRIKGILSYKKPAFWVILVALAACTVVGVCFLTNPKKNAEPAGSDSETTEPVTEATQEPTQESTQEPAQAPTPFIQGLRETNPELFRLDTSHGLIIAADKYVDGALFRYHLIPGGRPYIKLSETVGRWFTEDEIQEILDTYGLPDDRISVRYFQHPNAGIVYSGGQEKEVLQQISANFGGRYRAGLLSVGYDAPEIAVYEEYDPYAVTIDLSFDEVLQKGEAMSGEEQNRITAFLAEGKNSTDLGAWDFILQSFRDPSEIDLITLSYWKGTERNLSKEEDAAAFAEAGYTMPWTSASKRTVDGINALFVKYTGQELSADQLKDFFRWVYVPEYDAYYGFTSDMPYDIPVSELGRACRLDGVVAGSLEIDVEANEVIAVEWKSQVWDGKSGMAILIPDGNSYRIAANYMFGGN